MSRLDKNRIEQLEQRNAQLEQRLEQQDQIIAAMRAEIIRAAAAAAKPSGLLLQATYTESDLQAAARAARFEMYETMRSGYGTLLDLQRRLYELFQTIYLIDGLALGSTAGRADVLRAALKQRGLAGTLADQYTELDLAIAAAGQTLPDIILYYMHLRLDGIRTVLAGHDDGQALRDAAAAGLGIDVDEILDSLDVGGRPAGWNPGRRWVAERLAYWKRETRGRRGSRRGEQYTTIAANRLLPALADSELSAEDQERAREMLEHWDNRALARLVSEWRRAHDANTRFTGKPGI